MKTYWIRGGTRPVHFVSVRRSAYEAGKTLEMWLRNSVFLYKICIFEVVRVLTSWEILYLV